MANGRSRNSCTETSMWSTKRWNASEITMPIVGGFFTCYTYRGSNRRGTRLEFLRYVALNSQAKCGTAEPRTKETMGTGYVLSLAIRENTYTHVICYTILTTFLVWLFILFSCFSDNGFISLEERQRFLAALAEDEILGLKNLSWHTNFESNILFAQM